MAKFKLRIFKSCRSKDPSTLPIPIPSFNRRTNKIYTVANTTPPSSTKHQPHRSSFKSQVSSAFNCGSKSHNLSDSDDYFQWQEEDQWHVVAKIYDDETPRRKIYNSSVTEGDNDDDDGFNVLPLLPLPPLVKNKRRRGRRVKLNKLRNVSVSVSSGDSFLFSDGEEKICYDKYDENYDEKEEETETLISSSRSFSTDSSTDFNPQLETIRESACMSRAQRKRASFSKPNKGMAMTTCRGDYSGTGTSPEWGSPTRLSVFKKMIPCKVEGKIKESFAVVKKSEDPYDDFKKSMMEMIMEKQMFEEHDLEQLLQCFLSLNSRFHHGVIVDAFSEIWGTIHYSCTMCAYYRYTAKNITSAIRKDFEASRTLASSTAVSRTLGSDKTNY
ncbi:ovate family protein 7 [Artemisia annua]|uniref:Transcription repressor n=1 Tax=Artemisia annua TaxID=35608 RepID=A0A2U1LLJ8_ARTAN|nr:ovate family protein 7 [Artemisia annua]